MSNLPHIFWKWEEVIEHENSELVGTENKSLCPTLDKNECFVQQNAVYQSMI